MPTVPPAPVGADYSTEEEADFPMEKDNSEKVSFCAKLFDILRYLSFSSESLDSF